MAERPARREVVRDVAAPPPVAAVARRTGASSTRRTSRCPRCRCAGVTVIGLQAATGAVAPGSAASRASAAAASARRPAHPIAPAAARAAPLPQSGVLASTFVGGQRRPGAARGPARARRAGRRTARAARGVRRSRAPSVRRCRRDDAVALYAELERRELRTEGERVHLQIALWRAQGEMPARPRMDVRLVIDRSGSMHGDKWTNAIRPRTRWSIVCGAATRSGWSATATTRRSISRRRGSGIAAPRTRDRRAGDRRRHQHRRGARARRAGARRRASAPSDVLLVVLLSDGVANVGQTNADMIARALACALRRRRRAHDDVGVGTRLRRGDHALDRARGQRQLPLRAPQRGHRAHPAPTSSRSGRRRSRRTSGCASSSRRASSRRACTARACSTSRRPRPVRATEIATTIAARARARHRARSPRGRPARTAHALPDIPPRRPARGAHGARGAAGHRSRADRACLARLEGSPGTSETHRAAADVSAERTRDGEAALASTARQVKRTVLAFQAGDALQRGRRARARRPRRRAARDRGARRAPARGPRALARSRCSSDDLRILEQVPARARVRVAGLGRRLAAHAGDRDELLRRPEDAVSRAHRLRDGALRGGGARASAGTGSAVATSRVDAWDRADLSWVPGPTARGAAARLADERARRRGDRRDAGR